MLSAIENQRGPSQRQWLPLVAVNTSTFGMYMRASANMKGKCRTVSGPLNHATTDKPSDKATITTDKCVSNVLHVTETSRSKIAAI